MTLQFRSRLLVSSLIVFAGVMAASFTPAATNAVFASAKVDAPAWSNPANWDKVPAPTVFKNIVYFPSDTPGYAPASQVLDVYRNGALPAVVKAPVLVYMHGGAWSHGQKPESWHGFKPWLSAGFSVVNVEYRLVGVAPAPAAVQDVRCALHWIDANAGKYGFDTQRVVTYGTSAGGHLALMAAVLPAKNDIDIPQCRVQPHVAAVLDYYGPYHLEKSVKGAYASPSVALWMGPDPLPSLATKDHAMSPSTYIRPGIPPVFSAHGDADPVVPYLGEADKKADLDMVGVVNKLDTVPGGGHGKWAHEQLQQVDLDSLKFLYKVGVIP